MHKGVINSMASKTRERILRSALVVFSDYGYKGATTKMIAKEAGVNESTLFRIFETKYQLFHELFTRSEFTRIIDILKQSEASDNVEIQLTRIADLYKKMYVDNPYTTKIMVRCALDRKELDYINDQIGNSAFGYLVKYLQLLVENNKIKLIVTADEAAFFFLSMVHGALQRNMLFDELPDGVDMKCLVKIFLSGMTNKDRG